VSKDRQEIVLDLADSGIAFATAAAIILDLAVDAPERLRADQREKVLVMADLVVKARKWAEDHDYNWKAVKQHRKANGGETDG
jgi:hypothetical protein